MSADETIRVAAKKLAHKELGTSRRARRRALEGLGLATRDFGAGKPSDRARVFATNLLGRDSVRAVQ